MRRLLLLAVLLVLVRVAPAAADPFRETITVQPRAGLPRTALNLQVDALAREALIEKYLSARLSPALIVSREQATRRALQPVDSLVSGFTVITRGEPDIDNRVQVIAEAEIDSGEVLRRLIVNKVLSFGTDAPAVLMVPAAGTSPDAMEAVRGRLSSTLGAAGVRLLAAEATAGAAYGVRGILGGMAYIERQVVETRADLIAVVDVKLTPGRVPTGVVVDGTIQYTLIRPLDNEIVAEEVFTGRGSGGTGTVAQQQFLAEEAPIVGRRLAGQIGEAIFAAGEVIEPTAKVDRAITVNVFYRPAPTATTALMDVMTSRGLSVKLGDSRVALASARGLVSAPGFNSKISPADRLILNGATTVTELYTGLSKLKFGPGRKLQVAMLEYGDDYLGIEIHEIIAKPKLPPPPPPKADPPPAAKTDPPAPAAKPAPADKPSAPPAAAPRTATAGSSATAGASMTMASASGSAGASVQISDELAKLPLQFRKRAFF